MFILDDDSLESNAIFKLTDQGDDALDEKDYDGYITFYKKAWEVVPEPRQEWELANGLVACIGEGYYLKGELDQAFLYFKEALACHNGEKNSSISFRLGQICLEQEDFDQALSFLHLAWKTSDGRAFEEEGASYLEFYEKNKHKVESGSLSDSE